MRFPKWGGIEDYTDYFIELDQKIFNELNIIIRKNNPDLYLKIYRNDSVWLMSRKYDLCVEDFAIPYFSEEYFIVLINILDDLSEDFYMNHFCKQRKLDLSEVEKYAYHSEFEEVKYFIKCMYDFCQAGRELFDVRYKIKKYLKDI